MTSYKQRKELCLQLGLEPCECGNPISSCNKIHTFSGRGNRDFSAGQKVKISLLGKILVEGIVVAKGSENDRIKIKVTPPFPEFLEEPDNTGCIECRTTYFD